MAGQTAGLRNRSNRFDSTGRTDSRRSRRAADSDGSEGKASPFGKAEVQSDTSGRSARARARKAAQREQNAGTFETTAKRSKATVEDSFEPAESLRSANPETLGADIAPGPKNGAIVRGLKAVGNMFNRDIFKLDPANKKNDFFYGLKNTVNKVWSYTPAWLPAGVGGGAIATGVIFGILYKGAIVAALGGFFSSHVGWAVAAGVGGLLVLAGLVAVYKYFSHRDTQKAEGVRSAHQAMLDEQHGTHKKQVEHLNTVMASMMREIADLKVKRSSDASYQRGLKEGHTSGFEKGRVAEAEMWKKDLGEDFDEGAATGNKTYREGLDSDSSSAA